MAAGKTLAKALCALLTLASAGSPREPLCGEDGSDGLCGVKNGKSLLQRTSQLRDEHLHGAELDDAKAMWRYSPPAFSCEAGVWWGWKEGDGIGGKNIMIGSSFSQQSCEQACAKKSWEDPSYNGCTFSRPLMQCWAEQNMKSWTSAKNEQALWQAAFIPEACTRPKVHIHKCLVLYINDKKWRPREGPPCEKREFKIKLYRDGTAIAEGEIRLPRRLRDMEQEYEKRECWNKEEASARRRRHGLLSLWTLECLCDPRDPQWNPQTQECPGNICDTVRRDVDADHYFYWPDHC